MYNRPSTTESKEWQHAYQGGTFHNGLFSAVWQSHGELREVHEHLCHLVAPLTTSNVNDAVTVTVLGQRLGDDCLATSKSPRNGACTWDIRCVISIMPDAGTVTVFTVTILFICWVMYLDSTREQTVMPDLQAYKFRMCARHHNFEQCEAVSLLMICVLKLIKLRQWRQTCQLHGCVDVDVLTSLKDIDAADRTSLGACQ